MRRWWPDMTISTLRADTLAGVTTAVVALPQGIAFAVIAGLPAESGLYSAIIIPIIAALFGSSRHMISGPTTAISALVFGSLAIHFEPFSTEYFGAAMKLTLMVGLIQTGLALLRMGGLMNFVSDSVLIGFTSGAAITILIGQMPIALGLSADAFAPSLEQPLATIKALNSATLSTTAVVVVGALITKRLYPRSPYYLVGLISGTVYCAAAELSNIDYVTPIDRPFPNFSIPYLDMASTTDLAPSAVAIALVGLLEATAIARSLSLKSGDLISTDQEFFGQGLSNCVGSLFSCFAGSGSFTRSALNFEAGAQTPVAAVIASFLLCVVLYGLGPFLYLIPIPGIAGIIVLAAWRLIEFRRIRGQLKSSFQNSVVLVSTLAATLLLGLQFGIYIGVVISLLFFLRRTATPYIALTAPVTNGPERTFRNATAFGLDECPQLAIARIDGLLYFGSLDIIRKQLKQLEVERSNQKHLLLLLKGVGDIDHSGAQLLIYENERRKKRGGQLYLTTRQHQISGVLEQTGVITSIGCNAVFNSKGVAIKQIVPLLDPEICDRCTKRIFKECPKHS